MDGTVVKVHQHASEAKKGGDRAIGNSCGGKTTKIHMLSDANGNPLKFEITEGQVYDIKEANTLFENCFSDYLINDKGYDCHDFRVKIQEKNIVPIIPLKCNSNKENLDFDKHLYKMRHVIENLFSKIKNFRAVATRYDKLKRNYSSMVFMACSLVWLRL